MTTTRGVARLALFISALASGCGDNIHPGGGDLLVSPQTGLPTSETGTTATFTVTLTRAPAHAATVTLTSSNTGEGTVSPASLTFDLKNYKEPQSVTVTGVDDSAPDGNISYNIEVAADGEDTINVAVTNDDN